tara:strand:+ start:2500 stop:3045 length:546 start_codon:yes stop_codon:yes gene_type:complete
MTKMPGLEFHHASLYVRDMAKMVDFFTRVMGFIESDPKPEGEEYPEIVYLTRDASEFDQLVFIGGRPEIVAGKTNLQQLSFYVETLDEVREAEKILKNEPEVTKIIPRCHGNAWSVYFQDPEDNRLEIYCPTPWQCAQPHGWHIDFSLSDEEILNLTLEAVKKDPTHMPIAEWEALVASKL